MHNSNFFSLLKPVSSPSSWYYLAKQRVHLMHKRTILGPLWLLINVVIFSTALGSVYSGIFTVNFFEYISYVSAGFIGWLWVASFLSTSGNVLTDNAVLIRSYPFDKSILIWSHVMHNLICFFYQLPIFLIFYFLGLVKFNVYTFLLLPNLLIVFIINIGVTAVLCIIVTRFRDIQRFISSSIIIIMITTPILWKPNMVEGLRKLVYQLNPIYYIIELIRTPLLGIKPDVNLYLISITIAIIFLFLGCFFYKKYSSTIIFRI